MHLCILTNNQFRKMNYFFEYMRGQYDEVCIASAFFSETEALRKMVDDNINISLIVSLRFPTNCYSLEKIYYLQNVEVKFLLNDFHSKFYIFLKRKKPVASIIGSSNFTNGGLENNIETNLFSTDYEFSSFLMQHFNTLKNKAHDLEPSDLIEYKKVFDAKQKKNQTPEEDDFNDKILKNRNNAKSSVSKTAKEYLVFERIVNEIKRVLENELENYYPSIPPFIVIDHFWQWLKTEYCIKQGNKKFLKPNNEKLITMFREFYTWDQEKKYTLEMFDKSKLIFNKYLKQDHIQDLTKEELIEVYSNLHSGSARENRFHSAQKFVELNKLEKIKKSLSYLLYSNDDITLRIDSLTNTESEMKLEEFGSSCIQELIGWVFYDKYPIRNEKANFSVKFLGYKFDSGNQ